jgi:hypothetical protein
MTSNWGREGDWSSGMIPALGAGGREFDSRITPFCWHPLASTCLILAGPKVYLRSADQKEGKKK